MSFTMGRARLGGATASSGLAVRKNGVAVATRPQVNLIEGANVTLTVADDVVTGEVDVTIASSGGGGLSDADYGDVTVSGGGTVMAIDAGAVTLAKMADIATARLIGRSSGGVGAPEALTGTQATALLDVATALLKGLVPASGGGTTNFLRADMTFAAPPSGGGGGGSIDDALALEALL